MLAQPATAVAPAPAALHLMNSRLDILDTVMVFS